MLLKHLGALVLVVLSLTADARKVKRIRAGKHYKEHEGVHLVVNKVGCVESPYCLLQ